jgi:outer membrane cobalamin receptor
VLKHRTILVLIFFIASLNANYAQSGIVYGTVKAETGEALESASVSVVGSNFGVYTNSKGKYRLENMAKGKFTLLVKYIGFETIIEDFVIGIGNATLVDIVLREDPTLLDNVVVVGKSTAQKLREEAYAVEVVEAACFKNLSTNANDILGRISGVNIRQSGGVGSDFSLSLNGLSGRQVRFFLDGVPMDYFGTSLSLNNFSANIIDRIEVYKGVVPIHLSSDALGGAVNVVTGSQQSSYLDASYTTGSFGTNLASLNGQYRNVKSGFTAKIKSFYNRSNNNYKVPIKLVNFATGKEDKEGTIVERFHDGYESKMVWGEIGFTGSKFADQVMAGVILSDNYRELQQPANAIGQAKIPYGEVATLEKKVIGNFTFRKSTLLNNKLSVNTYVVGVFSNTLARDTASVRYNWFGNRNVKLNNTTGEIENRKTLFSLNSRNFLANLNSEYQLDESSSVTLNYSLNDLRLTGKDPFKNQNNTQFSVPNTVRKEVYATSYTNKFFREKFKATVFSKYYSYKISTLQTNYSGTELTPFLLNKDNFGAGITATYAWRTVQLKASYENATRFPEALELFGDGLNTVPSPSLLPEQSNNFNLGFIYNSRSFDQPFTVSINGFLRDASYFIIPVIQGIKVFHVNNGEVLSQGIDLGVGYSHKQKWVFALNATFLDLRDNNPFRNGQEGQPNALYKARLPNVPYLFGNASLSYRGTGLCATKDSYSLSLTQSYVNRFFYRWEVLASANKGSVPTQHVTNFESVYSFNDQRYNLSFSLNNLWDAVVYDNFQQQRPGRNFLVKLRYFFNNK